VTYHGVGLYITRTTSADAAVFAVATAAAAGCYCVDSSSDKTQKPAKTKRQVILGHVVDPEN